MGMEVLVQVVAPVAFPRLLAELATGGLRGLVAMVDGQLQMPGTVVPETWRDVRLRFPAGTVTLVRRPGAVAVVVFGNADAGLVAAQKQVAETLERLTPV
jgi:hypothetical protein